jgi:hypothetical protein
MRALVVYESMFGSTREVAERIAAGLRTRMEQVEVFAVAHADVVRVMHADLLVVGGPTHARGMSRPSTRQAAVTEPTTYSASSVVEPDAAGIGLREWFEGLPTMSGPAVAFDTRADVRPVLSGRASKGIAKRLQRGGHHLVDRPQSFLVTRQTGLKPGEAERAEEWGRSLAVAVMARSAT